MVVVVVVGRYFVRVVDYDIVVGVGWLNQHSPYHNN